MTPRCPLVTIGLPVYNGQRFLPTAYRGAGAGLSKPADPDLGQCVNRRNAAHLSRVCRPRSANRRTPQRSEHRALPNFLSVLRAARGRYFAWAADDDFRSPHFVSSLVERLEAQSEAVLATPVVIHIDEQGHYMHAAVSRPAHARAHARQPAAVLSRAFRQLDLWPLSHRLSPATRRGNAPLASLGGRLRVAHPTGSGLRIDGRRSGHLLKRAKPNAYAPTDARGRLRFFAYMLRHLSEVCLAHDGPWKERLLALAWSWRYVYRVFIRRSSLPSTVWYVARLSFAAALASTVSGIRGLFARPPAVQSLPATSQDLRRPRP